MPPTFLFVAVVPFENELIQSIHRVAVNIKQAVCIITTFHIGKWRFHFSATQTEFCVVFFMCRQMKWFFAVNHM